jgi:hypothetical protein
VQGSWKGIGDLICGSRKLGMAWMPEDPDHSGSWLRPEKYFTVLQGYFGFIS